ncbi:photosystem II S4 domain protein [Peptococcaceae bacterium]|nr:photosystem II S4 domain protein [Peptococcaceae bacterium]
MLDKKELLNRCANNEEKMLLSRVLDNIQKVQKTNQPVTMGFCSPYELNLIFSVVKQFTEISVVANGGYDEAERRKVIVYPKHMLPEQLNFQITYLLIEGYFDSRTITHRDCLGALVGLGLKRDKIGDIIVSDGFVQIIVDKAISDYIIANLDKIGKVKVKVREISKEELLLAEPKVKVINAVVASMRLDAVCAAGYGTSRSKVVREIKSGRVNVNWQLITDPSMNVKEGDMLSIRGRGRVKIVEVKGYTKRGRISLLLHKYV